MQKQQSAWRVARMTAAFDQAAARGHREDRSPMMHLVACTVCGCQVDLDFGADEPAAHLDASGTGDDPRAPGDRDDICDVCDYIR